tara:strand:+ start:174 stop:941 length:768 start_codon:yes stop_codon:yes gene_type:complete
MDKYFENKVALITGAGSGIGCETAKILAKNKCKLILVSKSNSSILLSKKLKKKFPKNQFFAFSADFTKEKEVEEVVNLSILKFKKIDFLINSAGKTSFGTLESTSLDDWNDIHNNNGTLTFLACKHIIPYMKKNKFGKIVNISSIAGRFRGITSGLSYAYTKSGLLAFTKQLAFQVAPFNINVNAFCPSQTLTPMLKDLINNTKSPKETKKMIISKIPLGRIASSKEQANVIVYLVSDKSTYITGSFIDSNGGLY